MVSYRRMVHPHAALSFLCADCFVFWVWYCNTNSYSCIRTHSIAILHANMPAWVCLSKCVSLCVCKNERKMRQRGQSSTSVLRLRSAQLWGAGQMHGANPNRRTLWTQVFCCCCCWTAIHMSKVSSHPESSHLTQECSSTLGCTVHALYFADCSQLGLTECMGRYAWIQRTNTSKDRRLVFNL